MAQQDIGALGSAQGPAVTTYCPLRDSLRRVLLWLVLFGLLLRKPNRTRQAWTLLPALALVSLFLYAAETYINAHIIFYLHRHICTIICESLQAFAAALAVLLAISDLIAVRRRLLRFLLVFLILFEAGAVALFANAPVVLSAGMGIALYGFFLIVFMIGHALLHALLRVGGHVVRRCSSCPDGHTTNLLAWSTTLSLLLGVGPVLAFALVGSILSRSPQLQSTIEYFRLVVTLSEALLGPYFVFFWFLLLALRIPLYRERLARSFGYAVPAEPKALNVAMGTPVS